MHLRFVDNRWLVPALAFGWALLAGLALQLWILPHRLPHLHAAYGLLKGGDWVRFQQIALDMLDRMRVMGWHAWELRPDGQSPAGIAAAAYYMAGVSSPWILLPLHAALFALSADTMAGILAKLTKSARSWIGVLPFIFFPSSLMIFGQIHKDVYSTAGILLLLFTLVSLSESVTAKAMVVLVVRTLLGLALIWIVRPYLVEITLLCWWAGFAVLMIVTVLRRDKINARLVATILLLATIHAGVMAVNTQPTQLTQPTQATQSLCAAQSEWLSAKVCRFAEVRQTFVKKYPESASMIDTEVQFSTTTDLAMYLPRALQIGLFAPFPNAWFTQGKQPQAALMRMVSSLEMLIGYIGITVLVWVLFRCPYQDPASFGILLSTLLFILIFALAIPNVGTLYRMRLPAWQLLVGWGLVLGWKLRHCCFGR